MSSPLWQIYEDAARKVLADIRQIIGVSCVEGERTLKGRSDAGWKMDAIAWREGSDGFLVVEVRRHTASGLKQEEIVGAVRYNCGGQA